MSIPLEQDLNIRHNKIFTPVFISLFTANALLYLGQQMCTVLVAKYADSLGASAITIGWVSSSFAITAMLFKFISAPAIDSLNRKHILVAAMLVMAAAFVGYSFSTSVPMLLVARLVQGTGQAFTATAFLALAADALPKDKIGEGISIFSLAQAICQAIGPTIGLKLASWVGYSYTFALAAVIMVVGIYFAARIKNIFIPVKKFKITLDSIAAKEALIPAAILFFLAMTFVIINAFLVIFGEEQGVQSTDIGYFFTIYAATLLVTRPLVGKLTDKIGYSRVILPAMLFFALSFVLISFASSLWMFLLAAFVSAFGFGACSPALQSLGMKMVPKERRGASSSSLYIGLDLANLAGPPLAGAIAEQLGYISMWRLMIIPIFFAIGIVHLYRYQIDHAGATV